MPTMIKCDYRRNGKFCMHRNNLMGECGLDYIEMESMLDGPDVNAICMMRDHKLEALEGGGGDD